MRSNHTNIVPHYPVLVFSGIQKILYETQQTGTACNTRSDVVLETPFDPILLISLELKTLPQT